MTSRDIPPLSGQLRLLLSLGDLLARVEEPDPDWTDLPARPGLYLVLWPPAEPLRFRNQAGAQGQALALRWQKSSRHAATDILYLGQANSVRNRIRQLARFGRGRATDHEGGRDLWWVDGIEQAEVLVQTCPEGRQTGFENAALERFHQAHGDFPLANRQGASGTERWWPEV
jgi:hypothetical protein